MTQLSMQTIRKLCQTGEPMIDPFLPTKAVINGKSGGLSGASYDARIDHDLILGISPAMVIAKHFLDRREHSIRQNFLDKLCAAHERSISYSSEPDGTLDSRLDWLEAEADEMRKNCMDLFRQLYCDDQELFELLAANPPMKALAYTVEDFWMPANVSAAVADKSSYARVFVSAFNTFFDPGFHGNATLELVNLGDEPVEYKKGDPVCQFIFSYLDMNTEQPYDGKYQHQTKAAHPARFEKN